MIMPGQVPLPEYVQIEPVGQCNLKCQMCPIQFRRDGPPYGPVAFMKFETFTKILDDFPGLKELHLQGLGEPLMHPRFFEMAEYAAAKGIKVSTNTNLTLINRRRAESFVTSGIDCIHISIDGATKETYERIRAGSHFERVLNNIELILEARRAAGTDHPRIRLVMVLMKQNLHELPQMVELAHRFSFPAFFVQHLSHDFKESSLPDFYKPMRDFVEEQTLAAKEEDRTEHYFRLAKQKAEEFGIDLRLPNVKPRKYAPGTPGRDRCDWPWRGAYISYQGLAMPCCMVATPDRMNFGNMAEQGVGKVWNNERYQEFRQQLSSGNPPEICKSCSSYWGTF